MNIWKKGINLEISVNPPIEVQRANDPNSIYCHFNVKKFFAKIIILYLRLNRFFHENVIDIIRGCS